MWVEIFFNTPPSSSEGGQLAWWCRQRLECSLSSKYWRRWWILNGHVGAWMVEIKSIHAFQNERFCGFVIHTDLLGCYGGRSPLKVMSNLICKAVFLQVFSAAYISLGVPSQISSVVCSKAVLSGRKGRYLFVLWPSIFILIWVVLLSKNFFQML